MSRFSPRAEPALNISLQKLRDHRCQRDKEYDADDAEQLSAKQRGQQRPQRGKPHAAADHMRIDELVFNELHRLIDKEAQDRLLGRSQQREQYADQAGGKRADIRDKRERRRQYRRQRRIGDAEGGKCKEDHRAENQHLDALAGEKLGISIVRQLCDAADAICRTLLAVGVQKAAALLTKLPPPQQYIEHDHSRKYGVYRDRYR